MRDAPLHSQAGNFLDCFKTAVDNRTGQFCLAIALPVPPANQLCGPTLSVTLAFSTLASSCNRGYGLGWSLGLSEINLDQDNPRLSLSSGEQFAIDLINSDPCSDGRLAFFDQKLPTFTVTRQADGNFRVDKQTGESEILRQQDDSTRYLLEEMRSPEGAACISTGCPSPTVYRRWPGSAMKPVHCWPWKPKPVNCVSCSIHKRPTPLL